MSRRTVTNGDSDDVDAVDTGRDGLWNGLILAHVGVAISDDHQEVRHVLTHTSISNEYLYQEHNMEYLRKVFSWFGS